MARRSTPATARPLLAASPLSSLPWKTAKSFWWMPNSISCCPALKGGMVFKKRRNENGESSGALLFCLRSHRNDGQCDGGRRTGGRGDGGHQARPRNCAAGSRAESRSEEHTSELQSLMRISYAVLCL